jgi:FAD dependent oxidoreductase
MGSCLSLFLARRGIQVTLFDQERAPMSGASRWNEGKIHLGYLYSGDPSLRTARRVLPGGLEFSRLVSDLLGESLARETTTEDDLYLVHRESVVGVDSVHRYLRAVDDLVREHPRSRGYLCDVSRAASRPLSRAELRSIADTPDIVAGFRVPERSIRTGWIADRLCDALSSEPRVSLRMGLRLTSATPLGAVDGPWRVRGPRLDETFDVVFNVLWHGRMEIDRTAGLPPEGEWSNRYRVSLFVRTSRLLDVPSAVAVVGPFGDVKNYNGRDFYMSWYPAGLLVDSTAVAPAPPRPLSRKAKLALVERVGAGLKTIMAGGDEILANAEDIAVEGGFVFAAGQGSLADPRATLHRRDLFGVRRYGCYFSVDTGKYSTAPWLADALANELAEDLR